MLADNIVNQALRQIIQSLIDMPAVFVGFQNMPLHCRVTHFFPTINPRKLYFDFHPVLFYINIILFYFVHFRMGNTADAGSDNIMFRCARSASKDEL